MIASDKLTATEVVLRAGTVTSRRTFVRGRGTSLTSLATSQLSINCGTVCSAEKVSMRRENKKNDNSPFSTTESSGAAIAVAGAAVIGVTDSVPRITSALSGNEPAVQKTSNDILRAIQVWGQNERWRGGKGAWDATRKCNTDKSQRQELRKVHREDWGRAQRIFQRPRQFICSGI